MNYLVDITGYAETYEELCNKEGIYEGEFWNVLDGNPFTTYVKTAGEEFNPIGKETDILGWYKNKAELESNVKKPNDQDVYIVGISAPYTRWKATVRGIDIEWNEDGSEELKIIKNYKAKINLIRSRNTPEDDIYYSIGEESPYEIYGKTSAWEPVGAFISRTGNKLKEFDNTKLCAGMVAFIHGIFYIYTEKGWKLLEVKEPIDNVDKHTYEINDQKFKIREGLQLGTLEFYSPRE